MKRLIPMAFLLGMATIQSFAHYHTRVVVEEPVAAVVVQPTAVVLHPAAPVLFVESAPPAEIEEDRGACPGENYVWIPGAWQWDGARWYRVHGHWAGRPHPSAVWVSGYWSNHGHRWGWTEGRWR